jgi:hypothetical protein
LSSDSYNSPPATVAAIVGKLNKSTLIEIGSQDNQPMKTQPHVAGPGRDIDTDYLSRLSIFEPPVSEATAPE